MLKGHGGSSRFVFSFIAFPLTSTAASASVVRSFRSLVTLRLHDTAASTYLRRCVGQVATRSASLCLSAHTCAMLARRTASRSSQTFLAMLLCVSACSLQYVTSIHVKGSAAIPDRSLQEVTGCTPTTCLQGVAYLAGPLAGCQVIANQCACRLLLRSYGCVGTPPIN